MKRIIVMHILRTLMLMVVLNFLCIPTASADFGWEQVVGGVAAGGDGFGDANNYDARSMAVFDSYLYVGTYNNMNGCEVWRSSNGTTWNQVNSNGFGNSTNSHASSMAVFDGYLYVGTYNGINACEIWRSSNGTTWNKVNTNGFGDSANYYATSMAVFDSYLYVGTNNGSAGCEVWRSSDGTIWTQVVGDESGGGGNGFSDSDNDDATSMAIFGGYLYVGTHNDFYGCEVWRSSDGTSWTQVVGDESGGGGNGFGDSANYGSLSMVVFDGYLYVGTYKFVAQGCEVWRSSNGIDWDQVNSIGFGDLNNTGAYSMTVFGDYLHVGTRNQVDGCEVWRSSDGMSWDSLNTDGFGDTNNWRAPSMAVFESSLYVGTYNGNDGCEVWRLPQDSDGDGIADNEDKCPCHPNGLNKGTCVNNLGNVIMSYEEGDELITCDDDSDCAPTGGYCQKVQGDCNWNGIGDVCEGYADFDGSGGVNLVDLIDLILCYGKTNFETYSQCEKYDTNEDNRVSAWDYIILLLQYGRDGFDTCGVGIAPARVAKTGQKTCYEYIDPDWVIGECLDTGQDGEYQKGVIGPSPRFTNHGDGTVTDNLTGLMWTRDTQQVSGTMTWSDALTECNDLDYATYTDWRLPNVRELWSLIDLGEYEPGLSLGHPFSNVQSSLSHYWSSTTYAGNSGSAFFVYMGYGYSFYGSKVSESSYAWCMRGETNGSAPVPRTGQTISYASGDDGDLQMGVEWPNPRFTDNADGTITDNLTGLIWLKNASCFGTRTWADTLSDVNGLASGSCGLTDGSIAGDWQLSNERELESLSHYGYHNPALPNTEGIGQWTEGDPFTNETSSYYWSSTTNARYPYTVLLIHFSYGGVSNFDKSSLNYVRAVRAGQ